ncbi:ArsR/SmtB family transcription factor [Actinomycetes bacterium NPDC127524]
MTNVFNQENQYGDQSNQILHVTLDDLLEIAKALSSDLRIEIFRKLLKRSMNVAELSEIFDIPPSTASSNIKKLEDVGLIRTELVPGTRGSQKLCAAVLKRIIVDTQEMEDETEASYVKTSMPIGNFFDYDVSPTCGLVNETSIIGEFDDIRSFSEPSRTTAQLIWFKQGYVEYRFPNRIPPGCRMTSLELSMELCSEAPLHYKDWPSDITIWINGMEIGTWTSPGEFGGERGFLTPSWWDIQYAQFGLLKRWQVSNRGTLVDGLQISDVVLSDLKDIDSPFITVRIGVKPDALNVGGINLFGRSFGNYGTDINLRLDYERSNSHPSK